MRDALVTYLPAALLVVLGFWFAYRYVGPAPPHHLTMSTGQDGGAYQLYGAEYREILARTGIDLEILSSAGSLENLDRLDAGETDLALVQGGVASESGREDAGALRSLASVFYEPIWIFARSALGVATASDLDGLRISIGAPGSGTQEIAIELLAAGNIGPENARFVELEAEEGAGAIERGEIDVVFVIAATDAPVVQRLARNLDLSLVEIPRSEALTRYARYLSRIVIPSGLLDLKRDVPAEPTVLVATAANVVARDDLHPALVDLIIGVLEQVHGDGGLIERRGEFPSTAYLDFPLDDEAARRYRYGPSFLQRYLPFWAATFVDRIKIMLLPVVALMLPLVRLLPPVYQWRIRARIYRWYEDLNRLDPDLDERLGAQAVRARLDELLDVEREVRKVSAPLSYAEKVYELRMHIALVRQKLEARLPTGP